MLVRSSELANSAGSIYSLGSYRWYPDLRELSLFIELPDGTRRTCCELESGRETIAGVEPACMLSVR